MDFIQRPWKFVDSWNPWIYEESFLRRPFLRRGVPFLSEPSRVCPSRLEGYSFLTAIREIKKVEESFLSIGRFRDMNDISGIQFSDYG